jgi:MtN3 and saliva related transmembrane protein
MRIELITGIVASICTGISMLPQLVKLIKVIKAGDICLVMLIVLVAGLSCWTAYGIMKKDWIIIISNGFSWMVNMMLIGFTIKYKEK